MGDPTWGPRGLCISCRDERARQRGITLTDLLGVLALSALALTAALVASNGWVLRQAARSSIYEVQSHLQLARVQAITRNGTCRFVIDQATRRIQVFDLHDPAEPADDELLATVTLSPAVRFERPDAGAPITLALLGGSRYQATFAAEGSVTQGAGEVVIRGDQNFHRVLLYGAGGVGVERWNGAAWTAGS